MDILLEVLINNMESEVINGKSGRYSIRIGTSHMV